jgi:predicted TIM-barrel fold metal-dependent hydrolase
MLIIDCHCHAGKGDGLTGPWDTDASLDRYLRRAAAAGIRRTVLFAAFHSDYAVANRAVGRIVRQRPDRFDGFAFVNAERDRGRVRSLVHEAVTQLGFCGIKVHRHDARITREVCAVAQLYRLPVLYDVMGEVAGVELLATEYPNVNFVIPHLGSFADDWRAQQAFLDPLSRHPNVFTDTSGVRRFDLLRAAVDRAGPRKVLFGSDGPWLHRGVELAKVQALGLTGGAYQDVVAGNYLRLTAAARRRPLPTRRARPAARAYADPWQPHEATAAWSPGLESSP